MENDDAVESDGENLMVENDAVEHNGENLQVENGALKMMEKISG